MCRCFQQGFGTVFGDLQESHGGSRWRAEATFSLNSGRFRDVEKNGEDGLTDIHVFADSGDFTDGNCRKLPACSEAARVAEEARELAGEVPF